MNKLNDEGQSVLSACFVLLYSKESFLPNAVDAASQTPVNMILVDTQVHRSAKTGKTSLHESSKMNARNTRECQYGNAKGRKDNQQIEQSREKTNSRTEVLNGKTGGYLIETGLKDLNINEQAVLPNTGKVTLKSKSFIDQSLKLNWIDSQQTVDSSAFSVCGQRATKCTAVSSTNKMTVGPERSKNRDMKSEGTVQQLDLEKSRSAFIVTNLYYFLVHIGK